MSFNLYQNNSAGIAALGPVQSMSDRNEAQTYMANGGQMFASGGIARLASGGLDSSSNVLPKYKYDPATQTYVLAGADDAATAMEAELLKKKRAAEAAGGSGSGVTASGPGYAAPSGQRLGEALASAGIGYGRVLGGFLPGGRLASFLGERYIDSRLNEAARLGGHTGTYTGYAAFGDRPNNTMTEAQTQEAIAGTGGGPLSGPAWGASSISGLPSGYEGVGGPSTYSSPSADPSTSPPSSEPTNSFESAYGYAQGGLAALAGGGITGSGNLDLHIPLDLGGGGGGGLGGYTAAGAGGQYGFNGQNNAGGGGFGAAIDPQGIMSDTFKGTSAFSGNPTESINNLFNVLGGKAMAQGGMARGGMSHLGDYSDGGRLLRGPGDGVSDSIPATIGDKRPARLADGEFVVPARIVSELGNGSTEAGARKLYAMMDRIQKARGKTVGKDRVAVNSRADKNLPA